MEQGTDAHNWTTPEVTVWLQHAVKLPEFLAPFRALAVDGRTLLAYDEVTLAHALSAYSNIDEKTRRKLLKEISHLKAPPKAAEKSNAFKRISVMGKSFANKISGGHSNLPPTVPESDYTHSSMSPAGGSPGPRAGTGPAGGRGALPPTPQEVQPDSYTVPADAMTRQRLASIVEMRKASTSSSNSSNSNSHIAQHNTTQDDSAYGVPWDVLQAQRAKAAAADPNNQPLYDVVSDDSPAVPQPAAAEALYEAPLDIPHPAVRAPPAGSHTPIRPPAVMANQGAANHPLPSSSSAAAATGAAQRHNSNSAPRAPAVIGLVKPRADEPDTDVHEYEVLSPEDDFPTPVVKPANKAASAVSAAPAPKAEAIYELTSEEQDQVTKSTSNEALYEIPFEDGSPITTAAAHVQPHGPGRAAAAPFSTQTPPQAQAARPAALPSQAAIPKVAALTSQLRSVVGNRAGGNVVPNDRQPETLYETPSELPVNEYEEPFDDGSMYESRHVHSAVTQKSTSQTSVGSSGGSNGGLSRTPSISANSARSSPSPSRTSSTSSGSGIGATVPRQKSLSHLDEGDSAVHEYEMPFEEPAPLAARPQAQSEAPSTTSAIPHAGGAGLVAMPGFRASMATSGANNLHKKMSDLFEEAAAPPVFRAQKPQAIPSTAPSVAAAAPPTVDQDALIRQQPWFKNIGRPEAEAAIARDRRDGCFIVRPSDGRYSLSLWADNKVYNIKLRVVDGKWAIGESSEDRFSTLIELVHFFTLNPVQLRNSTSVVRLSHPCSFAPEHS
ncbi:hypothetical protein CAOG_09017 [Capsaspora owczarzaki ATCC 30864]|uniref:SH2 domain-containing protein n=1 Tax=Capsaspora owczarzaki (strain ATCC 30864) TaxID=595528 RepID=A0A0D2VY68_CAPO3|nr:hypothetical protein CAOG_09017 [Capsaspora owczarzaki ATCC 30864]KJE96622.1 hypothetical protein CAOG_009017 [Capsaspora owczarzaki ATCC 30864]|eukprot:XP_011270704.1 hypothetical protein CAOG_09017 [Capsaspora owczarzaki ATCC 30864]